MEKIRFCTERLIIRQFEAGDAEGYFSLYSRPRVHCFENEKIESFPQSVEETEKKSKVTDGSELAVCLKDGGGFAGHLFGMWEGDTFSVCWNFLPEYGGKGYAFEAARAYLDFLFFEKGARRIYAYTEDYNESSQKLCRKLGMRLEGEFKEFISFVKDDCGNPVYENTRQFAILKKEWEAAR